MAIRVAEMKTERARGGVEEEGVWGSTYTESEYCTVGACWLDVYIERRSQIKKGSECLAGLQGARADAVPGSLR